MAKRLISCIGMLEQYKEEMIDPPETPTICLKLMSSLLRASSMPIWAASLVPPPDKIGTIFVTLFHQLSK
jgi:hypothetical protein